MHLEGWCPVAGGIRRGEDGSRHGPCLARNRGAVARGRWGCLEHIGTHAAASIAPVSCCRVAGQRSCRAERASGIATLGLGVPAGCPPGEHSPPCPGPAVRDPRQMPTCRAYRPARDYRGPPPAPPTGWCPCARWRAPTAGTSVSGSRRTPAAYGDESRVVPSFGPRDRRPPCRVRSPSRRHPLAMPARSARTRRTPVVDFANRRSARGSRR